MNTQFHDKNTNWEPNGELVLDVDDHTIDYAIIEKFPDLSKLEIKYENKVPTVEFVASPGTNVKLYLRLGKLEKKKFLGILKERGPLYIPCNSMIKTNQVFYEEKIRIAGIKEANCGSFLVEGNPHGFEPYSIRQFQDLVGKTVTVRTIMLPYNIWIMEKSQKPTLENWYTFTRGMTTRDIDKQMFYLSDEIGKLYRIKITGRDKLVIIPKEFKIPIIMPDTGVLSKGDWIVARGRIIGWRSEREQ